uniref:Uncharacterized protein n=1 Tax=Vitis vinifera TaxID=29760 RepID=F6HU13_VITVI
MGYGNGFYESEKWRVLEEPRGDSWLRKPAAWGDTSHEAPCTDVW